MIYDELLQTNEIAELRTLVAASHIRFIKFQGRSNSDQYIASEHGFLIGLDSGCVIQIAASRGLKQPYQERLKVRRRLPQFDPSVRSLIRKCTEIPLSGFGPSVHEVTLFRGGSGSSGRDEYHYDTRVELKDKKGACITVFFDSPSEGEPDVLCLSLCPDFAGGYYGEKYLVIHREVESTEGAPDLEPMVAMDIESELAPCLSQGQQKTQNDTCTS